MKNKNRHLKKLLWYLLIINLLWFLIFLLKIWFLKKVDNYAELFLSTFSTGNLQFFFTYSFLITQHVDQIESKKCPRCDTTSNQTAKTEKK